MTEFILAMGCRVRLTPEASAAFPDLAHRLGTILRVDRTPVVRWDGREGETSLPAARLEVVT